MTPLPSAPSARQFLRTLGLVALAIAGVFTVDTFLAKTEESESRAEAARLYAEGQRLLREGDAANAASRFEDALAFERDDRDFQLALAQAQLAGGQVAGAEETLKGLLLADSTGGPANLAMARALVKEGKVAQAISYYHRAIYGAWPNDAAGNQLKVRFELIDLLAQQNRKEELLGELLAVQDQAPRDIPTRLRLGSLFLEAGSAARAAAVFEEVLEGVRGAGASKEQAKDVAAAYSGLGEANFARGDYRGAADDFSSALRLNPEDQAAKERLSVANRVLELDPSRRGLGVAERYRRSHQLLELTLNAVENCSNLQELEQAHQKLAERVAPGRQDSSAEDDLDLAEQLWNAKNPNCGAPPDDALALVLAKAAQ